MTTAWGNPRTPKTTPPARPSATRRSFHRVGGALYLYAAVPALALFFLLLAVGRPW